MNDSLKMFLIALVVAVGVQLFLAPYVLEFQGFRPSASRSEIAVPIGVAPGQPQTVPAAGASLSLTAPNLEGMAVTAARERFRDRGLVIIEDGLRADPSVAPGTILQQRPTPGAAMRNMEVRVIVARMGGELQVPDVLGKPEEAARSALVGAGFEVPPAQHEASEKPKGTVINQVPNPGAQVKAGAAVHLILAEDPGIQVPKVTGMSLRSAREELTKAGLTAGSVRRREHRELGEGFVLGQTPEEGALVPPGTPVDLVVVAPN